MGRSDWRAHPSGKEKKRRACGRASLGIRKVQETSTAGAKQGKENVPIDYRKS